MDPSNYTRDDASSIYSRAPDAVKTSVARTPRVPGRQRHQPPEINLLDHEMAMGRGSTMALETTRSRLQSSKRQPQRTFSQMKEEKLHQRTQQQHENDFYRECFESFHVLVMMILDAIQSLALHFHFNPHVNPPGSPRVLRAIILLRVAIDKSRAGESSAEREWKKHWHVDTTRTPPPKWL